ncbi:polysaccharide deacetylase family protein [Winogradskyella aurantiaca]|uniref:polysaccharide deacetylase family protein n=1 Tax=Winogradskyella aurantiaca TaxID=2219558 RepID=UPI000E1DB562|nr:polysaccharide deacetylase family protein [Winogradskyella aurantiaca]
MQVFPTKTPDFVKSLFPQFLWHLPDNEKVLYLTFDDGPTPEITDWVLNCLENYNAKATFFCIGKNIDLHPLIFDQVLAKGHVIGNHTYHHLKGWKSRTKTYMTDVSKTQDLIQEKTDSKLFRPPYGKFKSSQARKLLRDDYTIVLWDVLSYDWDQSVSPEKCFNNVISKARNGSIIVMHDSVKASNNLKYALPRILDHFTQEEYHFKSLPLF